MLGRGSTPVGSSDRQNFRRAFGRLGVQVAARDRNARCAGSLTFINCDVGQRSFSVLLCEMPPVIVWPDPCCAKLALPPPLLIQDDCHLRWYRWFPWGNNPQTV